MPIITKDLEPAPLGMKRPLVTVPPLSTATDPNANAPTKPADADVSAPIEFERKFLVPPSALDRVKTIRGVERRMVYDTYIKPEVPGLPPLRFRFETSIDPMLGNSEGDNVVIAYADFTVKTGDDASKRRETIYPLVFHTPNQVSAINAFGSIYGARVSSERYRWSGAEGKFQLVIYPGPHMTIELETSSESELSAFRPPATWREVTQDPRYSNYSIAACGWPEESTQSAA